MTSGYGKDSHNFRRNAIGLRPPLMPEPVEFEIWDLTAGVHGEKTPKEIPLNATPFCENVRFEGTSLRPDFGISSVGLASEHKVLGLADHKYIRDVDGEPRLFQRIMRVVRTDEGYAQVESLEDGVWTVAATSTLPLEDTYLSVVSTQNQLVFADGANIYKWNEPSPNLVTRNNTGFIPSDNLLTSPGDLTDVRGFTFGPAYDDKYQIKYNGTIYITMGLDPKGFATTYSYTVSVKVKVWGRDPTTGLEKSVQRVHTANFAFSEVGEGASGSAGFTFDGEVLLTNIKSMWLELDTITLISDDDPKGTYVAAFSADLHGVHFDEDGEYGIVFQSWDPVGGSIVKLSNYAPAATHIFPFADRLIALQDEGNPQAFNVSADADIGLWWGDPSNPDNTDTVEASLLDSIGDPLDDLMACGFVAGNRLALIRRRTIMQVYETGNILVPIGVQHWVEGIGTDSPHSVTQARDGICFLGHNLMVYYFDGTGPPVAIGTQIHEILRRSLTSNLSLVDATYDPIYDQFIMGVPEYGSSIIERLWIFDLGDFLDKQEMKWRSRAASVERLATVSTI